MKCNSFNMFQPISVVSLSDGQPGAPTDQDPGGKSGRSGLSRKAAGVCPAQPEHRVTGVNTHIGILFPDKTAQPPPSFSLCRVRDFPSGARGRPSIQVNSARAAASAPSSFLCSRCRSPVPFLWLLQGFPPRGSTASNPGSSKRLHTALPYQPQSTHSTLSVSRLLKFFYDYSSP